MAGRPEQRVRGLLWRRSLEQTRESAGAQQAGQWSTYCVVLVSGVCCTLCTPGLMETHSLTHSFSGRAMD